MKSTNSKFKGNFGPICPYIDLLKISRMRKLFLMLPRKFSFFFGSLGNQHLRQNQGGKLWAIKIFLPFEGLFATYKNRFVGVTVFHTKT